jgi:flagellin
LIRAGTDTTSVNAKASAIDGVLDYDNSAAFAYVSQMALQNVADMRAQNGAEMSRVNFAQDLLQINAINLEAANSRIMDVDVAAESSQLARFQILQQAGTAMLAQANTSQQSLVRLLQG